MAYAAWLPLRPRIRPGRAFCSTCTCRCSSQTPEPSLGYPQITSLRKVMGDEPRYGEPRISWGSERREEQQDSSVELCPDFRARPCHHLVRVRLQPPISYEGWRFQWGSAREKGIQHAEKFCLLHRWRLLTTWTVPSLILFTATRRFCDTRCHSTVTGCLLSALGAENTGAPGLWSPSKILLS